MLTGETGTLRDVETEGRQETTTVQRVPALVPAPSIGDGESKDVRRGVSTAATATKGEAPTCQRRREAS